MYNADVQLCFVATCFSSIFVTVRIIGEKILIWNSADRLTN